MKQLKNYIGICGFTSSEQVFRVCMPHTEYFEHHEVQIMVGAMTSYSTVYCNQKHCDLYVSVDDLADIFSIKHSALVNTLHFIDYDGQKELAATLRLLRKKSGPYLDAIQLDMIWPDPQEVWAFKQEYPSISLVLQIGRAAIEQCNGSVRTVAERVKKEYAGIISHVLIDKSGGEDILFDEKTIIEYFDMFSREVPEVQFAFAGGIGPLTLWRVHELIRRLPAKVSFDAQSKLHDKGSPQKFNPVLAEEFLGHHSYMYQ